MIKKYSFLLTILGLLLSIFSQAQNTNIQCSPVTENFKSVKFCENENHYSQDKSGNRIHSLENEFIDRFGNKFHKKINKNINEAGRAVTDTPDYISPDGLFALYLADPDGVVNEDNFTTLNSQGDAYRNVLAQLFADVESLIIENGAASMEPVKFEIRSFSATDGPLGAASSYYDTAGFPEGSVIAGNVWKAINSGVNDPNEWDGYIRINFSFNWFTDFNNPTSISNEVDMYGVLLHELMHALGFASGIDASGSPELGFYYPYDTLLKTESGTDVIVNSGSIWSFNPALNTSLLTSGCESPVTGIRLGDANFPVFAPDTFFPGTSLSHIDRNDDCLLPSDEYLMGPGTGSGETNRLDVDQINVLCDLNYLVSNSYGHANVVEFGNPAIVTNVSNVNVLNLPGCNPVVFGGDDIPNIGVFDNCDDTIVQINEADLLNNDTGSNLSVSNLTDPSGNELIVDSGVAPNRIFLYNPTYPDLGTVQLRYQPMDDQGNFGNYTYVDIEIIACPGAEFGCTNSDPCNLICNPHIIHETLDSDSACQYLNNIPIGWRLAFSTPDWLPDNPSCENTSTGIRNYNVLPGDFGGRISFGGGINEVNNGEVDMWTEGISTSVKSVQPNTKYLLSYHKNDGINTNLEGNITGGRRLSYAIGLNVTLSKPFGSFPSSTADSYYYHDVATGTFTDSNTNIEDFENNHTNILVDNTVTQNWSQTVVSFTSPADIENEFLNFSHPVNGAFYSLGIDYPTITSLYILAIDGVELIEDRLHQTPTNYLVDCGTTHTIGIDLCDVTNMQYQWWDVTNPGTPVRLTDLVDSSGDYDADGILITNPATQYNIESVNANGSQIVLSDILGPVNLQLRRVFPVTFGGDSNLVINNNLTAADSIVDVAVSINSGGIPADAGFSSSLNLSNCLFSFQSNETYDMHEWDFGDGTVISGVGTDDNFVNPTHGYASGGSYLVTHTVSNECGSISSTQSVFAFCTPPPCTNCESVFNDIDESFIESGGNCGEYAFVIAPSTFDCYSVQVTLEGQPLLIQEGTNLVNFDMNGAYAIDVLLTSNYTNETCNGAINVDVDCHISCNNFQPDFTFSQDQETGCPLGFVGINNGDDCPGQTYLWEVFDDENGNNSIDSGDISVYQTSEISFDSDDFSFPDPYANYIIQFTIFDPNSDYSETLIVPWPIADTCYDNPCTDFELDFTFLQTTPELCPIEFVGQIIGDVCQGQTYLWQVFDDANGNGILTNDEELFHTDNISFDVDDFSFPDQNANYYIQFTVFDPNSDYSDTLTVQWIIPATCYQGPCIECDEVNDIVLNSISTVDDCNKLQVALSEEILNCYDVYVYIDDNETQIEPGTTLIEIGDADLYTLVIVDAFNPRLGCLKEDFEIECCPNCVEAFDIIANSIVTIEDCHFIQITVPQAFTGCFNAAVDMGEGLITLETGVNTIENLGNDLLVLHVFDINNLEDACIKKEVEIECCPSCEDAFDIIANSVTTIEDCHFIQITVPQAFNSCFTAAVDMGDGFIALETGINTIENLGNNQFTLYVFDISNPENSCKKDEVAIECCPDCLEVFQTIANSAITIKDCHFVQITVPQNINDCFFATLGIGGGEILLETGVNTFEYNDNEQLVLYVYDLNNPDDACLKEELELICCSTCSDIRQKLSDVLSDLSPNSCGNYTLEIPQEIFDCYRIRVLVNGVSTEMETSTLDFSFEENGEYPILIQPIRIGGDRCRSVQSTIEVGCFFNRNTVSMYPNPAESNVSFELSKTIDEISQIVLKNVLGRTVINVKNSTDLNVSSLNSGIYFVTVITKQNDIYMKRLIVK
ncbi:T9SS type A sorting domain-containing protein [Lacinutrix iliipiscaria]|uniref:T9SS type A sorting domain-containing protein n=1 Tax=Lacinutrix iliipiscaria TaxID=1230532 RepID=A0ABW5WPP2_9FLAO